MEEGGGPLFMGSRLFPFETKREGGALLARYDLFFPLDSQITRVFCSMMRLTAIRVVTCMTHEWIFVQDERGESTAYLKMVSDQERLNLDIMSLVRLGKHVWA